MTIRSRTLLALHSAFLRSARTPLAGLWRLAYRLAARAWAAYLVRGEPGSSAYVRGSIRAEEVLPGLSDVDVAVVVPEDSHGAGIARLRVRRRWLRLRRVLPAADGRERANIPR